MDTRALEAFPRLRTNVRPLRRPDGALQVGTSAHDGVVLHGLTVAERTFVERLDGGTPLGGLRAGALRAGARPERLDSLLQALDGQGFLHLDAGTGRADEGVRGRRRSRRAASPRAAAPSGPGASARSRGPGPADGAGPRAGQRVVVDGSGPVATALAQILRDGGVGLVEVGVGAADAVDLALRTGSGDPPDLLVFVCRDAPSAPRGQPWRRRHLPHLAVCASPGRLGVGPLVLPHGPCLRCLDLARTDRDPAWPYLLAQVDPPFGSPVAECDAPLAAIGAGLAAHLAHALLDDGLHLPGISLEITWPDPVPVARRWAVHPRCGCTDGRATMGP